MAEITNVYLRIKYRKNGELKEDDILDDDELFDIISEMEYNGISYGDEENLILV